MLNLDAAAFKLTNKNSLKPVDTFSINIKPLPNAIQDKKTMLWWADRPAIWTKITEDQVES